MHRTLMSFAALMVLTACQTVVPQPDPGASTVATGQGADLSAQWFVLPSRSRLPKYVTLSNPTSATLNWTPVSPQVYIAGRLLPSALAGNVVSFVVPGGSRGGWGGPQTLQVREGPHLASRTSYVLGRSYLASDVPNNVMILVAPGKTLLDLQGVLKGRPLSITDFTPLAGPAACQGSLAEASAAGSASDFEALLEQLDHDAALHPEVIVAINPRTTSVTGAIPPSLTAPADSLQVMDASKVVGAAAAAARGLKGEGGLVAVFDTGIGQPGPGRVPFGTRLLPGQQFTRASHDKPALAKVTDDDFSVSGVLVGHGTQVASLAVGASYGVAPAARVMPIKVCDAAGQCRVSDIVRGLCWALADAQFNKRLRSLVVNLSLGGDTGDFERDVLRTVLAQTDTLGVQLVASAGNTWNTYLDGALYEVRQYPAALNLPNLTAVGAAEQPSNDPLHLQTSRYSVRGAWVDVLAPGTLVLTNGPMGEKGVISSGTSFAAPQVAGALAIWHQRYPSATAAELQERLKQTANLERVLKPNSQTEADPYTLTRLLDLSVAP